MKAGSWRGFFREGTPSAYISKKDPTDILADSAQTKIGKLNPKDVTRAVKDGVRESIAQSRHDGKLTVDPLREQLKAAAAKGEFSVSGELKLGSVPEVPAGGYAKGTVKTTFGNLAKAETAPAQGFTNFGSFALGTAFSVGAS